jgi:uncharacterized membrane protein YhaH (DUF805 family)
MTEISVLRRHREFFWAAILASLLAITSYFRVVSFSQVPIGLVATIFIGILTGTGGLLVFFHKYGEVIRRAKEQNKVGLIDAVFMYPAVASALGLFYAVLITFIQIDLGGSLSNEQIRVLLIIQNTILLLLLLYSILSFIEAISFLRRVMIGESGHDNRTRTDSGNSAKSSETSQR